MKIWNKKIIDINEVAILNSIFKDALVGIDKSKYTYNINDKESDDGGVNYIIRPKNDKSAVIQVHTLAGSGKIDLSFGFAFKRELILSRSQAKLKEDEELIKSMIRAVLEGKLSEEIVKSNNNQLQSSASLDVDGKIFNSRGYNVNQILDAYSDDRNLEKKFYQAY